MHRHAPWILALAIGAVSVAALGAGERDETAQALGFAEGLHEVGHFRKDGFEGWLFTGKGAANVRARAAMKSLGNQPSWGNLYYEPGRTIGLSARSDPRWVVRWWQRTRLTRGWINRPIVELRILDGLPAIEKRKARSTEPSTTVIVTTGPASDLTSSGEVPLPPSWGVEHR